MEERRKIPIPEDVVNAREYLKWYAYNSHPLLRNPRQIVSTGEEVSLGLMPHLFAKAIEHLSTKEQEDLMEMKKKWMSLNAKRSAASAKAYGRAGCLGKNQRTDKERGYKLSPYEEDIMELLGRMFTVPEVMKILGEENGICVSEDDVKRVLKTHIIEIERRREEYRNKITDVRLYNKRPRLDELCWMYSKMKSRYIVLNSIDAYNVMLRTLEQIRKEAEGDVLNINGVLDINIEATIQNHIQKEILKTINLKEIILGRVAARMGFDLKKLIAGLHNSYYAKFVDIGGDYDPQAEMVYPSTMAYDFTAIEKQSGREVQDIKAEEVTEEEKTSAQRTKEMFLNKIRRQKEDLEQRQGRMDVEAEALREPVDEEPFQPVKRGFGRAKDKIIFSKRSENQGKVRNRDYYTGEKKTNKKK